MLSPLDEVWLAAGRRYLITNDSAGGIIHLRSLDTDKQAWLAEAFWRREAQSASGTPWTGPTIIPPNYTLGVSEASYETAPQAQIVAAKAPPSGSEGGAASKRRAAAQPPQGPTTTFMSEDLL